jgi:hypothetical protein
MKLATACLTAALLLAGCARNVATPSAEEEEMSGPAAEALEGEPSLVSVLDLDSSDTFRSEPYLRAAIRLQSLGREAATKAMAELARRQRSPGSGATVLCRMLFAKKTGVEFRRPKFLAAVFLGGTDYADWPLEPIEVVDGVPFLIVHGYRSLSGPGESGAQYLAYCIANCDWAGFRYAPKTAAEKEKALDKLIRSPKWKQPLDDDGRDFLSKQVR